MDFAVIKADTKLALLDPQVGDRFHEMYSFWLYVVHRDGDLVVTMESNPLCSFPADAKVTISTVDALYKRLSYDSIEGFWIDLADRGNDVDGWYTPEQEAKAECPNCCRPLGGTGT